MRVYPTGRAPRIPWSVAGLLVLAGGAVPAALGGCDRTTPVPGWHTSECDACTPDDERCSNGADDDLDGLTDCDDPDCAALPLCAPPEPGPEDRAEVCADGVDQDEDGYTDCDDYDCRPTTACTPAVPEPEATVLRCSDGLDNDADGQFDCDDPDCAALGIVCEGTDASCSDGIDNDSDGFTDCQDFDCTQAPGVTVCGP